MVHVLGYHVIKDIKDNNVTLSIVIKKVHQVRLNNCLRHIHTAYSGLVPRAMIHC